MCALAVVATYREKARFTTGYQVSANSHTSKRCNGPAPDAAGFLPAHDGTTSTQMCRASASGPQQSIAGPPNALCTREKHGYHRQEIQLQEFAAAVRTKDWIRHQFSKVGPPAARGHLNQPQIQVRLHTPEPENPQSCSHVS